MRVDAFAKWRIRGLGRRAAGRTHDDLRNAAFLATLDGTRSWNRDKVDFLGYLIGAMRSISDNWGKRFNEAEPLLESEIGRDDVTLGALDRVPAATVSPEEILELEQQREAILALFADDPLVTLVICEIEAGAKYTEIGETHGIAQNDLGAAIKRLRRKLARQAEKVLHG